MRTATIENSVSDDAFALACLTGRPLSIARPSRRLPTYAGLQQRATCRRHVPSTFAHLSP